MKGLAITLAALVLAGCSNPSIVRVDDTRLSQMEVSTIYVPRFEGSPDFVEESTDYFIAQLEPQIAARIIQGSALRSEGTDVESGGNLAPTELGVVEAKAAGADLLIMGKVTSHKTDVTLNGFSTVRVIDVATGQIIANFHRPSGKLFGYSEHQLALAAVKRTADDVAAALR